MESQGWLDEHNATESSSGTWDITAIDDGPAVEQLKGTHNDPAGLDPTPDTVQSCWFTDQASVHSTFSAHGRSVVTCLLISHGRIISASDDHTIHVYSLATGTRIHSLEGHDGGVWAIAATKNTLVSGSTDRTIRVWDLETGRCNHVLGGHTSTVRCIAIVRPELTDYVDEQGVVQKEKWPERRLIVSGSRDHTVRVWTLPRPGGEEYTCHSADDPEKTPSEEDVEDNPYHKLHLEGHDGPIRSIAARGRTAVSGSYDCTVRVWDIITGQCNWVLTGHTQKVYTVALDLDRNRVYSGSMDSTVRIWDVRTGECHHILTGHTSLVGLLAVCPSYLVSASADATLRVWDPISGALLHTLAGPNGAVTAFQNDEDKVLSAADGVLSLWDIRTGRHVRNLPSGAIGIWQVAFKDQWCVAASSTSECTVIDVWEFGKGENDVSPRGLDDEDSEDSEDSEDYSQDGVDEDKDKAETKAEDGDDTDWVQVEAIPVDQNL